jgi:acyl carrier protein
MNEIRAEVYRILVEQFYLEEKDLSDGIGPGDFPAWNSLGHLQFIMKLEQRFRIRFSADDVMSFENVGDLILMVERSVKEATERRP